MSTYRSFYSQNAQRYAQVAHEFIQSVYVNASHPGLASDLDLMKRMKELVPAGGKGLDAGCGAGARDVFFYWRDGYDIVGFDAVPENIETARKLHPEIADRVSVGDLRRPLPYEPGVFDFVLCNAVIQHLPPETVTGVALPELARVLKPGGLLQLMFKSGAGEKTVYDKDYGANRTFQLYDPGEIVGTLENHGTSVEPAAEDGLGGLMYFTDPKPMEHCVFFGRKGS